MLHILSIGLVAVGAALVAAGVAVFFLTDCRQVYHDLKTTALVMPEIETKPTAINDLYYDSYAEKKDAPEKRRSKPKFQHEDDTQSDGVEESKRQKDDEKQNAINKKLEEIKKKKEKEPQGRETAPLKPGNSVVSINEIMSNSENEPRLTAPLIKNEEEMNNIRETAPLVQKEEDAARLTAPLIEKESAPKETEPLKNLEEFFAEIGETAPLKGSNIDVKGVFETEPLKKEEFSFETAPLIEKDYAPKETEPLKISEVTWETEPLKPDERK